MSYGELSFLNCVNSDTVFRPNSSNSFCNALVGAAEPLFADRKSMSSRDED